MAIIELSSDDTKGFKITFILSYTKQYNLMTSFVLYFDDEKVIKLFDCDTPFATSCFKDIVDTI